ncbi:MAG: hypothetical protein E7379_03485 [Clostridiales bacterium]|nr:hypothetical protein [Clostridiales bacterium]
MNFIDDKLLSIKEYEVMAKAYADALQKNGFKIINAQEIDENLLNDTFSTFAEIKSLLLALGGFLNTSPFYSLNERQIKKLTIMFDREGIELRTPKLRDKTKNFLSFLSCEFSLIKNLFQIAEKSTFESDIKHIINQRLSLLSQILAL